MVHYLLRTTLEEIPIEQDGWKATATAKQKINAVLDSQTVRYVLISIAVICLILPDPFSDVLAFWILAKAGTSINHRWLRRLTFWSRSPFNHEPTDIISQHFLTLLKCDRQRRNPFSRFLATM